MTSDAAGRRRGDAPERIPSLLVAYDGSPMSEAQLHLACRAANNMGGRVRVLHVVESSRHVPLDVPLPLDAQARVDALLDRAEGIAMRYNVECTIEVDRSRSVGESIIAEAAECEARTIFIGLRDRNRPRTSLVLSATLRHVLQHAPCPVQIGYLPAGLPENLAGDETGLASDTRA